MATADSVTSASGTPALTVQIQESADGRNWANKSGTAEINAASIPVAAVTTTSGSDAGTTPMSGFVRLAITLSVATTPAAHVKIYVTGRGDIPVSG